MAIGKCRKGVYSLPVCHLRAPGTPVTLGCFLKGNFEPLKTSQLYKKQHWRFVCESYL